MKYDITKPSAPVMPKLGKGTECIKILLSQVSKDMCEPLVPMLFPILGAHVSGSEFQYPDLTWKELCGQMANLVAESGGNKGQLSYLTIGLIGLFHDFTISQFHNFTISRFYDFTISRFHDELSITHYALRIKQAGTGCFLTFVSFCFNILNSFLLFHFFNIDVLIAKCR